MATTIDRTIEQFDLIDRYTAKLEQMSRHTDRFAAKVNAAQRAVSVFALASAGALGAAVVKLGTDAVQTAAKFEQFAVTLEALTGSADVAQRKLDFIRKLAIPSTFTFQELAEAGVQLEAFRVPLEKALPLIAKLGAAFPNKEVGDFVNLFGRLASGDFPDLEALSGAGLSKLDFMKQGIKFDAQGSLLSSTRQTMDALARIVEDKYGKILEKVSNTTTAKLATARDKWEQNLRKIGDAIVKYLNPALDKISVFLDKLDKDRGFDNFLNKLGASVTLFVGLAMGTLAIFLAVMAAIQLAVGNFFGAIILGAAAAATALAAPWVVGKLGKFFKDLDKMNATGSAPPEIPQTPPGIEFPDNPALATLNDIEKNTARTESNTRQALDLRRFALGGGDIGAMGIPVIDRYGGRSGGRRQMSLNINGARDELASGIRSIAMQIYHEMHFEGR